MAFFWSHKGLKNWEQFKFMNKKFLFYNLQLKEQKLMSTLKVENVDLNAVKTFQLRSTGRTGPYPLQYMDLYIFFGQKRS